MCRAPIGRLTTVVVMAISIAAAVLVTPATFSGRLAVAETGVPVPTLCTAGTAPTIAAQLGDGVSVKQVPNGPRLAGGVDYVPAAGNIPGYCQMTGSYVTNPRTGKTANFLATFPENWNGSYLQLGCSGACGFLLMNDPAALPIAVTAQGYRNQLLEKGYAVFGNDLGHVLPSAATQSFDWLRSPVGGLDGDALDDYLYRADLVMADLGKDFTRAFYSRRTGAQQAIVKSYFSGCSQGGREALVAATRFPEKFDGIIAGSPAINSAGILWHSTGLAQLAQQSGISVLSPSQAVYVKHSMVAKCDEADGVRDGIVQNPAGCDFDPKLDLKVCSAGQTGDDCLTAAQADMMSALLAGVTDEAGRVVQPGYAAGDLTLSKVAPVQAGMPLDDDLRFVVGAEFANQPLAIAVASGSIPDHRSHVVANRAAYDRYFDIMRAGTPTGTDFGPFFESGTKLLWYHNLADEALTPYMSFDLYQDLARRHGGYQQLRQSIRLFPLPNTGHCGVGGEGPGSFDAMGTLENWVERGVVPNAIRARALDPASENPVMGTVDWSKPAPYTMPLCAFPQMAAFTGGDVKDATNWRCDPGDTRMLQRGGSAGIG